MRTLIILLILAGQSLANSYSTNFPAGEMGKWTQGRSNGVNWSNVVNTPGFAYGTQDGSQPYNDSTAVIPGSWGNDQSAQATVALPNRPNQAAEVEIRLRTTITPNSITGYEFNASVASNAVYMQIVRWNGALNNFTFFDGREVAVKSGDVLLARAQGNVLSWLKNGTVIFSVTDSRFSGGSPGIGFYSQNSAINSGFGFSSFSATDNGSSAPSPTPSATPLPQAYATWEASLLSEMQAAGIPQSRINTVQAWLANNPPKP